MRKFSGKLISFTFFIMVISSTVTQAAEIDITITAHKDRSTKGVVVELVALNHEAIAPDKIEIDQVDKEFVPLVSVVPIGSTVLFNNLDELKHHVYSVSSGNQFDLPLHNGVSPEEISLDKSGVVKLGCNIHDWMLAYVYVSESDRVKTADDTGIVSFTDVPAGKYEIRLWSPRLRNTKVPVTEIITIAENQTLKHTVKLKLRKRIRKPKRQDSSLDYSGNS